MQKNKWQRNSSFLLVAVLFLSIFTPIVPPLNSYIQSKEHVALAAENEEEYLSIEDAIKLNNNGSKESLTGYIVGYVKGTNNVSRDEFPEDHNFALADNPGETDTSKMIFVQLTAEFRSEFGLKTNPDILDKKINLTGTLEKYHGGYGLKNPSEMAFDSDEADPEEPKELELISIKEAREQKTGEAKIKGIVSAKLKNTIHIEDGEAGIAVRPTSLDVELGDEITVVGKLQDYQGLLQLDSAKLEEKNPGTDVVPKTISASDLQSYQSELVTVEEVTITSTQDGNGWANHHAEDKNGNKFIIRDENGNLDLEVGPYGSITGISSQFNDDVQIIPRSAQDIVYDKNSVQPVYATPGSGMVPNTTEVTLTSRTDNVTIYYTLDGSEPTKESTKYTEPILIDKNLTLKAIAINDADVTSEVKEYKYEVYDADKGVKIHDIQGEGHESPMKGRRVENVQGIVTYKYDIRGAHYFHIQTPDGETDNNPKTSEGLVIYTGREENVEIGNKVAITGTVDEFHIDGYDGKEDTDLSVTQINARDDRGGKIEVSEEKVDLPAPVKIKSSDIPGEINGPEGFDTFEPENYSIDFWESIEGMRVEVEPSTAVAPQLHGDLVVITDDYKPENRTVNGGIRLTEDGPDSRTIQFKLHPNGKARDFAVKTGDKFTEAVTGVVNYGFGNYKVYADLADLEGAFKEGPTQPKGTKIEKDEDKLTVAAYNVENFSANTSETPKAKAENIAKAFVDNMNSPDIIGIVEVMANNGQASTSPEAHKSYERLVDEIKTVGGPAYEFANIDPEFNKDGGAPGGNIRVGYLYNPERVDFVEGKHGGTNDAVDYKDGKLSLNPGRVSPEDFSGTRKPLAAQFEFNGESIVLINNHLNSKIGDDPYYGQKQPPVFGSREQRKKLAKVLNNFVKEIKADNPDENVVVLGDMNDFEFSEPVQNLKGNELVDMIDHVPEEERYSYVYQGSSQVLDHILVSNNIEEYTEIDIINVNSDFTDMHNRASDHDPVLSQIDLAAASSEGGSDDDYFDLSVMHMNDTHARAAQLPFAYTAVKEFRENNKNNLLLHAGDVFSGTLYFNEHLGQADLALMNLMAFDAMVFGNHEFDLGSKENGHESLAKFVKNAEFPLLGTNIDFSKDPFMKDLVVGETVSEDAEDGKVHDSVIVERDGEKIGIFGLTTGDTKDIASPMEVDFLNYLDSAREAVAELEAAGINKIIALTHLGYDTGEVIGSDLILAEKVEGIDIVVGGHSHTKLEKPTVVNDGKTVIVQTGQYAENLGTLQVSFDDEGNIVKSSGELIELKGDNAPEADEDALKVLQPYKDAVDKVSNEEIGAVAKKDLLNPRYGEGDETSVRADETELGNLVTDAMLAKAREKYPEVDIAVQNGGGLRAPIMKGPITVGEVINVLPFGNDPVIADLTGAEIKEILEHSVHERPAENGGFLHIAGMKYYYDSHREVGNRVVKMYLVEDEGKETEIKMDQDYVVTTNGFTGAGGDGFETFEKASEEGRVKDIGEIDWQQLRDYMVEEEYLNGIVDPEIEGRITDLEGESLEDNEINELKDRIKELEEKLKELEAGNKELADEIAELYKLLAALQGDVEAGNATIEELLKRIAELETRIAELEKQDSESEDPETQKEPGKDDDGKDDEGKGSGGTGGNGKDSNGKGDGKGDGGSDDSKGSLPKTGTDDTAYLIAGVVLLAGGATLFIIRKRKPENE